MPDIKFGKKVVCRNCGVKFYDLNRKPATCPSCGTEYIESSNETMSTTAKQVFVDNVDTVTDNNLVGSDASESIAEISDISLDDEINDDTISLEDTEEDDQVMTDDVDMDINSDQTTGDIDQD